MARVVAIASLDLRGYFHGCSAFPFVPEVLLSIRRGVEHYDP